MRRTLLRRRAELRRGQPLRRQLASSVRNRDTECGPGLRNEDPGAGHVETASATRKATMSTRFPAAVSPQASSMVGIRGRPCLPRFAACILGKSFLSCPNSILCQQSKQVARFVRCVLALLEARRITSQQGSLQQQAQCHQHIEENNGAQ